ncbi:MOP flippase family protein [Polyangium sp. 6x1]|uniref:MOP flippase family protein n=1 Tax=Polyangium sp. 6x1 TaxID=3042689 RepID=UPI002482F4A5|nr:MOP flippase family protein [Polyangium sp. 6x1]MDI1450701.1 MOP flippase family protein [Polyangium sp. 6x1]
MSLLRSAARGGVALGASQTFATALGWIRTLVLARILVPEDFGLVGLCTVLLGFLGALSDMGLTAATIQRKELSDGHRDAAFWMSVSMGAVLFLASIVAAPALAAFYGEPRVVSLVLVSALPLLIGPFASTHAALLRRELRFGRVAAIEAGRNVAASAATLGLAALGVGYWSLVFGPLASHLVGVVAYTLSSPFRPRFRATWTHVRELFSFSAYVAGASAINYLSANMDYMIVGKRLGTAALGTYTFAYETMTFPLTRIASLFAQVMFPAFATIQDKLDEMRETYLKISRAVAIVSFPILAWVAVVAPELVTLLYGPRWLPAVGPLRALSVAGALKAVGTLVGIIFKSRGKPAVELYWNIAWLVGLTAALLIGVRWGAFGVAVSISVLCVPGTLFTEWLACRYIEMKLSRLLRVLVEPTVAVALATAAGAIARIELAALLPAGLVGDVARLVGLTLIMLLVYVATLRVIHPPITAEVRAFLGYFRREKKAPAKAPPQTEVPAEEAAPKEAL